jgi:hypothetical protein
MNFISINARVTIDSTGAFTEVPVLLTDEGVLQPLMDYCLAHSHNRSLSWMKKVVLSVTLFLRYIQVNQDEPYSYRLFQNFAQRLYTGSFDRSTGIDPSGLCWKPFAANNAGDIINRLTDFFDWLSEVRPSAAKINPRYAGNAFDKRIDESAYLFRREKAFLGHTWANHQIQSPGNLTRTKRAISVSQGDPPAFPDDRFEELLVKGFKVGGQYDYRGMLITLLMHGAGFRMSEPFHLYIHDVVPDPSNTKSALVLIHHPSEGMAPSDWTDKLGRKRTGNRVAYLSEKYALAPRNEILSSRGAGWKNPRLDNKYYMQAYWFIPEYGELFLQLWQKYLQEVARLDRNHPFAFINLDRAPVGAMYCIDKYTKAHGAAIERLGMQVSKQAGTTPHGHRHAYARRLKKYGIDSMLIQRYMHHASIDSQIVYTQSSVSEALAALRDAGKLMRESANNLLPLSLLADISGK